MHDQEARLYSAQYAYAREIARKAHDGQLYGPGTGTYFDEHLMRVVERVAHHGVDAMTVAVLHDVIEDTAVGLVDLAQFFDPQILTAVAEVTHKPWETYETYITSLCASDCWLALVAKQADLESHIACAFGKWKQTAEEKWLPALAQVLQARYRIENT